MTKKRTRTPLDEFEGYQKKLFRKGHSFQKTQGGHFGLGSKELILKKKRQKEQRAGLWPKYEKINNNPDKIKWGPFRN